VTLARGAYTNGVLNNLLFRNTALWLEKSIYKNAKHIIASPGMEEGPSNRYRTEQSDHDSTCPKYHFYPCAHNVELLINMGLKKIILKVSVLCLMASNGIDYIFRNCVPLQRPIQTLDFIFYWLWSDNHSWTTAKQNLDNARFLGHLELKKV
jgi:hypothetical protein